ncbi:hypothetical protein BKA70DRAFT_1446475 [Coprinopsis sp. MPI-PUGE-AT-0042]|nr:hypothetical protein BKA70DRAFT_1446475 [Coprinopsis sp. MPI-PUGE-AT-0042]
MVPASILESQEGISDKSFAERRAELDSLPKNTLVDAVLQLQLEVERLRQRIKFVDTLWYQSRRNLELLFNKLSSSAADPGVLSVESMSDGRIPN